MVTRRLGFVHSCCKVFILPLFFTGCISITVSSYCLMMCVAVAHICCFRLKCSSFPVSSVIFWSCGNVGRDSSVSIATRYGLDDLGIESRWGVRFSAPIQTVPGAHPASYTMGTGSLLGGKAAGAWH